MPAIRDFWIRTKSVLRAARAMINAELEPLGLTGAEGDMLFHLLAAGGGLTQERLAELLDIGKAPISRTVGLLTEKGYVRRERDPGDRRAYRITPTERAEAVGARIERAYNGAYEAAKSGIDDAEFARLGALLAHVADNLHAAGARDGA